MFIKSIRFARGATRNANVRRRPGYALALFAADSKQAR
jgi:hypothetical protein